MQIIQKEDLKKGVANPQQKSNNICIKRGEEVPLGEGKRPLPW
jgi:hypothetical protein